MAIKDRKPIFEMDADQARAANFLHPFSVGLTSTIAGLASFKRTIYIDGRYFEPLPADPLNAVGRDDPIAITNAGYFIPKAITGGGSSFEPAQYIDIGFNIITNVRGTYKYDVYQPETVYIDGWYSGKTEFLKHLIKFDLGTVTGDPMGVPHGQWLLDAWTNIRTFPNSNSTDDVFGLVEVRLVNFNPVANGLDFFHEKASTADPLPFYEKNWGL